MKKNVKSIFRLKPFLLLFSLHFARRSLAADAKALAAEERRRAVVDDVKVQRVPLTA